MPPLEGVTLRDVTGTPTDLADPLEELYLEAFSREPHHDRSALARAWAREQLPRHADRPGFRMLVAEARDDLAGFAYGFTGVPGQWWTDTVRAVLTDEERARWLQGHFELAELAVAPGLQQRGIGGALHDALLHRRPERTAALSAQDANDRALAFYRHRGWNALRVGFQFPGDDLGWTIMVRDLATPVRSSDA